MIRASYLSARCTILEGQPEVEAQGGPAGPEATGLVIGCTITLRHQNGKCGRPVSVTLLVRKAIPPGTAPQYDVDHVCDLHLRDYGPRVRAGLVDILTEEEALIAEVMLS